MGLFTSFKSKEKFTFPWINLIDSVQLKDAIENSSSKPILLFKHSTRCSISSMALNRFEKNWKVENNKIDLYYLDLLSFRDVSNEISEITGVIHQSPQVIVLKNQQVIYDASHSNIDVKSIEDLIE